MFQHFLLTCGSDENISVAVSHEPLQSHAVNELIFDNPVQQQRAHDVAVAYRLAMAEVWVQLPLGASANQTFASGGGDDGKTSATSSPPSLPDSLRLNN